MSGGRGRIESRPAIQLKDLGVEKIAGLSLEAFENDAAPEKSAVRNREAFARDVEGDLKRIKARHPQKKIRPDAGARSRRG